MLGFAALSAGLSAVAGAGVAVVEVAEGGKCAMAVRAEIYKV